MMMFGVDAALLHGDTLTDRAEVVAEVQPAGRRSPVNMVKDDGLASSLASVSSERFLAARKLALISLPAAVSCCSSVMRKSFEYALNKRFLW